MFRVIDFDEALRGLFSTLFRAIIAGFALYLIGFSNNAFPFYAYALGTAVYLLLFHFLRKHKKSYLRLVNDFLYIFFVVYEKDFNNPAALIFILLPIINSPNHSGKSSSPFTLISLSFLVFMYLMRNTTYFNSKDIDFTVYFLVPSILILIIVLFEVFRSKLLRLNEEFNRQIDLYYSRNLEYLEKPYKIFRSMQELINSTKLLNFKVDRLLCFRLKNNKLSLIGGSEFVYQYAITGKKEFIDNLRSDQIVINNQVVIGKQKHDHTISYLMKATEIDYIFLLTTNRQFPILYQLLQQIFARISKVLIFEYTLNEQKAKYLERLKNKMEFMDDAQMAMHFIKNKLGPISNFLKMADQYNQSPPSQSEWSDYFVRERNKANVNIPLIVEKTQSFHRNVESIFSLTEYELVSVRKLIELSRNNWTSCFSDETIKITINTDDVETYLVELNDELFEVLLTDWIANMSKYNNGLFELSIEETTESILLNFVNSVSEGNTVEALRFAKDFNSDGKSEIINRKNTQGLREMRFLVKEMQLNSTMRFENEQMTFTIQMRKKAK